MPNNKRRLRWDHTDLCGYALKTYDFLMQVLDSINTQYVHYFDGFWCGNNSSK